MEGEKISLFQHNDDSDDLKFSKSFYNQEHEAINIC